MTVCISGSLTGQRPDQNATLKHVQFRNVVSHPS